MRGTRAEQARQAARFLKALRRTANVTMAAEEAGISRKAVHKRRARNPDFAAEWDAALSFAQARLAQAAAEAGEGREAAAPAAGASRTRGGEYSVRASRGRTMQVRRAPGGLLTAAGERRFLAHLAATANVRLSAAATGIGWSAIYARRRRSAAFARQMEAALAEGCDRLELALLAHALDSLGDDRVPIADWQEEDWQAEDWQGADGQAADGQGADGQAGAGVPEPLQRMTFQDAMLLLRFRRSQEAAGGRHPGIPAPRVSQEELERNLTRALDRVERRLRREG